MTDLLFLHGAILNRHMWDPVMSHLSHRWDTKAIDLPGHGSRRDAPFEMDLAVSEVLAAIDGSTTIVGLSLGGYVAQAVASRHPDRVDALVLSGATLGYTGWSGLSTRLYGLVFPLFARSVETKFSQKLRADFGDTLADAVSGEGLSTRGAAQALRRLPGTDYAAELQAFRGPILVINGERDTPNRSGEERFAELNPEANLVMIPDTGHVCALQKPADFASAIEDLLASVG